MEDIYITKVLKMGNSHAIIIPTKIKNGYGWQRGDNIIFTFADTNQLIIKKLSDEQIRGIKHSEVSASDEGEVIPTIKI